jgi:low affinity Fe/Cu permease
VHRVRGTEESGGSGVSAYQGVLWALVFFLAAVLLWLLKGPR